MEEPTIAFKGIPEMSFSSPFSTEGGNRSHSAFVMIAWTVLFASLIRFFTVYYLYSVRWKRRPSRRRKLTKSIQRRPRRRVKLADAEFRKAFTYPKSEESKVPQEDVDESTVSDGSEYEEYEDYDLDESSLKEMKDQVPDSTKAECRRFLIDKDGDTKEAIKALQSYIDWRKKYSDIEETLVCQKEEQPEDSSKKDNDDKDLQLWEMATAVAIKANEESSDSPFPRIVRSFKREDDDDEYTDNSGNVIIKLCPGKINDNLVSDIKTYSLAIALYLDKKLDRNDPHETMTLIIDVRGGKNWPNPSPRTLLPFLKHTVRLLLDMFPERLHQAIIFPVPGAFGWIWSLVQRRMDPETADRCRVVSGAARISSEPPTDELTEYMSREVVEYMEEERLASFGKQEQ